MNKLMVERSVGDRMACLNTAVEESTLGGRWCGRLLHQDHFIKEHVTPNDTVVVSVGGNDIALRPNCCTILNMLVLSCCTPTCAIESGCGCAVPVDDCCCGCGIRFWLLVRTLGRAIVSAVLVSSSLSCCCWLLVLGFFLIFFFVFYCCCCCLLFCRCGRCVLRCCCARDTKEELDEETARDGDG